MEFNHISVLLEESVNALDIKPDGIYADCTAGGGGHSAEVLKHLGENGRMILFDRDPDAIETVTNRFKDDNRVTVIHSNFSEIKKVLAELGVNGVDGIIADLGVSSHQLDTAERGFSFHYDAPLDMRMSQQGTTAEDIVNSYSQKELFNVISKYGEEKFASSVANAIVRAREKKRIETTLELAEIVSNAIPAKFRRNGHPARKTFQAIRIEVNAELTVLESTLPDMFEVLNKDGVLAIISFHSLEDRIVKNGMAEAAKGCTCPPNFPVCVCGKKPKVKLVSRKPIVSGEEELERNPRARSAKLRICEKI